MTSPARDGSRVGCTDNRGPFLITQMVIDLVSRPRRVSGFIGTCESCEGERFLSSEMRGSYIKIADKAVVMADLAEMTGRDIDVGDATELVLAATGV